MVNTWYLNNVKHHLPFGNGAFSYTLIASDNQKLNTGEPHLHRRLSKGHMCTLKSWIFQST